MHEAKMIFTENEEGHVDIAGVVKGDYDPSVRAHRLLQATEKLMPEIMQVASDPFGNTDGERYRALIDFGLLGEKNRDRFDFINEQQMAFEEEHGVAKDEEGQRRFADNIIKLLRRTEPTPEEAQHDLDRIAAAEAKRERKAEARVKAPAAAWPFPTKSTPN